MPFTAPFFLFGQQCLSRTVNVACAHGQNNVAGLYVFTEPCGNLRQGFAEHGTGDLRGQVHRGDTYGVSLPGCIDLSQHQLIGLTQFSDKVIKQRMGTAIGMGLEGQHQPLVRTASMVAASSPGWCA